MLLVVLSIVGLVARGESEAWVASWSAPLGTITFHDLGTVAPPAVIGGVTMTPFHRTPAR